MKCDPVLAGHLDHFRDVRRTWRNLAIQCAEHFDRVASDSRDLEHLPTAGTKAKPMNGTGGQVYQCA